eukprot:5785799-Prymnesium_polylepis.1
MIVKASNHRKVWARVHWAQPGVLLREPLPFRIEPNRRNDRLLCELVLGDQAAVAVVAKTLSGVDLRLELKCEQSLLVGGGRRHSKREREREERGRERERGKREGERERGRESTTRTNSNLGVPATL